MDVTAISGLVNTVGIGGVFFVRGVLSNEAAGGAGDATAHYDITSLLSDQT